MLTDLQVCVVHAVRVGAVKLGVVGDVEQLNDQVAGEQLCHKSVLKEEVTICDSMQIWNKTATLLH